MEDVGAQRSKDGHVSPAAPDETTSTEATTDPRPSPPTTASGTPTTRRDATEGQASPGVGRSGNSYDHGPRTSGFGASMKPEGDPGSRSNSSDGATQPPPSDGQAALQGFQSAPAAAMTEGPQQERPVTGTSPEAAQQLMPVPGTSAPAPQAPPAWLQDPDYEVPRGTVTETQVLQSLGLGEQPPVGQVQKTDKYGFLLAAVPENGDGDGGRHQSGAAASSSGAGRGGGLPARLENLLAEWRQDVAAQQNVRRVRKWLKMAGSDGTRLEGYRRRRPEKVKRRVRKGIPDEMRRPAWLALSGGLALKGAHPGLYGALLALGAGTALAPLQGAAAEPPDPRGDGAQPAPPEPGPAAGVAAQYQAPSLKLVMDIMRDLSRTFPTHANFMRRQGMGQKALFSVLWASAAYRPAVGYVQGLGFLAAVLLLYMVEEEAFWALQAVMQGAPGWPEGSGSESLFTAGMPGLQCCLYQFKHLLRDVAPRLASHMERLGVEPELFATHWFNTAFAYTLPMPYLLRVWDVFLAEGPKTIFRVGLAVLQYAEDRLLAMRFEGLLSALSAKALPALLPPDPEKLLRRALRIPVSRRLAELRADWERQAGPKSRAAAGATGPKGAAKGAPLKKDPAGAPVPEVGA